MMVLVVVVEKVMMGSSVAFRSFPKCIADVAVFVWGVAGIVVVEEVRNEVGNSKSLFHEQTCC